MSRIAIVAPCDGPLGAEIIDRLVRNDWLIVSGFSGEIPETLQDHVDRVIACSWNPGSFVSTRNLIMEAITRFGSIDSAIFISESELPSDPLHTTPANVIEERIDSLVRGAILFAKETLATLIKQGSGRLSIVQLDPEDRPFSILGSVATSGVSTLAESLLGMYGNERVSIDLFESKKQDIPGFAEFVLSAEMRGAEGKIHRFGVTKFPRLTLRGR